MTSTSPDDALEKTIAADELLLTSARKSCGRLEAREFAERYGFE